MENRLYPKSFNQWAGNPCGTKPDYTRCCEEVRPNERGGSWMQHQCSRKRGFGPDGAYCRQHDPDAVKKRQSEAQEKWDKQMRARRYEWHGKRFYDALKVIADGHNDARGHAQDIIKAFDEGR